MFAPSLKMVLLVGLGCCGKSLLARHLRDLLGYHFINTEKIKQSVGENALIAGNTESRKAAYQLIYEEAFKHLGWGRSVILDSPHILEAPDESFWKDLNNTLALRGLGHVELVVVWVYAEIADMKCYLKLRGRKADKYKLKYWDEFLEKEVNTFNVAYPHLKVKTPDWWDKLPQIGQYIDGPSSVRTAVSV